IGGRIDEGDALPADLAQALRAALGDSARASAPVAMSVSVPSAARPVHLTIVDAMSLRRAPTDLRALLRSTLEVMRRQAESHDVTLTWVVDERVPSVMSVDAVKISWAVTALVGNALRYVRHGSRSLPGGSINVRVTAELGGGAVRLEVADDG